MYLNKGILDLNNIKLSKFSLTVLFIIPILWLIFGYYYVTKREAALTLQKHQEVAKEMHNELKTLISEKEEAILIIAMAISNNPQIKNVLLNHSSIMNLDKFSKELRQNTSLKNIWFQVLSADGTSLYRSWTKKRGDNLQKARIDIAQMVANPKITSSISTGKFDLSFKSMVPLYDENKFIGFVEVIAKFNSIAIKMNNKNYDTVILVDKKYKKQLSRAFTKNFIEDYYVANLNAKSELLAHIKKKKIAHFLRSHELHSCDEINRLISVFQLNDIYDNKMSYFLLFHKLDQIDLTQVIQTKERLITFIITIFFFILLIYYYFYARKYKRFIQDINTKLGVEVKDKTKELQYIANHDSLTQLPNRLLFLDRLEHAIEHAKRQNTNIAVFFLDLDRFKEVNDTYGHQKGDKLLQEISKKLQGCIREEDTISRLGGDEFTIILENVQKAHEDSNIINVAKKIIQTMEEKIIIDGTDIYTTFSIGISIFPQDGSLPEILLRNADTAMYRAKDLGKNQYQFYNQEMTDIAMQRVNLENDLRLALQNNEFVAYFQPKVNTLTNKIIGMEALIRWNHPSKGLIYPDQFIGVAEDSGLIIQIDQWMIENGIAVVQKWQEEGIDTGKLSLNLSKKQLENIDCIEKIKDTIQSSNFDNHLLEFEVTEREVMHNPETTIPMLKEIKKLGVQISMDDFGTGYSSLSYLKYLPIDTLKIDRSFIKDIPNNSDDSAIAQAIISLAKSLKLNIIAEGVETKGQKDFLTINGCYNIQGYYYSKPIPASEYKEFLKKYQ